MFDFLHGRVVEKGPMHCVLEVGGRDGSGVGYHLTVSMPTAERLPVGETARLLAHLHVRDVEHRLFGFLTLEERALFRLLLTVSGVGPGLAIKLLSGCPHDELRRVIQEADLDRLKKVRGVGGKTAQRIIVDLRDAIGTLAGEEAVRTEADDPAREARRRAGDAWEDALLALLALGYNRGAAEKALQKAMKDEEDEPSTEVLVRSALRLL